MNVPEWRDIARLVDHSLLHPAMADAELAEGCRLAFEWGVAAVCVKPYFVASAHKLLHGSEVATGTTIGFPHGGHSAAIKVAEAQDALTNGARELDMVVNIGKAKSGEWGYIENEIAQIVQTGHQSGGLVKVIFENCYLTDDEKRQLCRISRSAGADFIKTSTGYGTGGATEADLRLMLDEAGSTMGVKAAGGVRTLEQVLKLREMGVKRVGLSQTAKIREEWLRAYRG